MTIQKLILSITAGILAVCSAQASITAINKTNTEIHFQASCLPDSVYTSQGAIPINGSWTAGSCKAATIVLRFGDESFPFSCAPDQKSDCAFHQDPLKNEKLVVTVVSSGQCAPVCEPCTGGC